MNVCVLITTCAMLAAQVPGVAPGANATQPAPLRVFRADTPGLQIPVAIQQSRPTYTREDLQAGVQGEISLEVTIGPDGRVRDAMVMKGIPASPAMDDRAIATLAEWRFQPATLNGQPVAVRTTISFTMSIR